MSNADERLFDPALLFRMQLRPVRTDLKFGQQGWLLPDEAELPSLGASISGQANFATLKLAVSESGLFMSASVRGKRQLPWCRESRIEDSDGLHVWIDTRHAGEVHRATRFCHRFIFAPMGRGPKSEQPFAGWAPINRARENSRPPSEKLLAVSSKVSQTGYDLSAALHWQALTGFDRNDFPVLGFYAAVIDRELGWQSLGLGPPHPVMEDPSLWCELSLAD
ncbi:MAG: hypothetical protein ACTHOU_02040 [Aureliella sp.]